MSKSAHKLFLACALGWCAQIHPFAMPGIRLDIGGPAPLPQAAQPATELDVQLPLQSKSVRFAVIGDSGTSPNTAITFKHSGAAALQSAS